MSVMVYRRVRGLCKGFEKRLEVLKEGIVGVEVQGSKEVKDRSSRFEGRGFCTGLYSRLLYFQ